MKKIATLIVTVLPLLLWGQINVKKTESWVKEATVYPSGARVVRSSAITWTSGDTRLKFAGLSSLIDHGSVQVKSEGTYEVISVNTTLNHLEAQLPDAEVKKLNDQLARLDGQLEELKAMHNVYDKEETMLMANQAIGTDQNGVSMTQLQQMADFFRNRLTDLKSQRRETDQKIEKLSDRRKLIAGQLTQLRSPDPADPTTEVEVVIRAHEAGEGTITLSYFTDGAQWTPLYDLRVDDTRQPVKLVRKAEVWQNTGEDWNKIKITLSSANPKLWGAKPNLGVHYLNSYSFVKPAARQRIVVNEGDHKTTRHNSTATATTTRQTPSTTQHPAASFPDRLQRDFAVATPYTIRSDGRSYYVSLGETLMPGQFEFQSVPAKEASAFVVARIPGWESYDLLSGEMSLFFEGTYLGQSHLDATQTADTLELSLGRDPFILVDRKLLKEFTSDQSIGSSRKSMRAFEITVRNTKSEPVTVRVEDQFPVSQVDDIRVELTESNGALVDQETGKLTWIINLPPAQSRTITFRYEVKFPKSLGKFIN